MKPMYAAFAIIAALSAPASATDRNDDWTFAKFQLRDGSQGAVEFQLARESSYDVDAADDLILDKASPARARILVADCADRDVVKVAIRTADTSSGKPEYRGSPATARMTPTNVRCEYVAELPALDLRLEVRGWERVFAHYVQFSRNDKPLVAPNGAPYVWGRLYEAYEQDQKKKAAKRLADQQRIQRQLGPSVP
jgi:hypothetical protein